MKTVNPARLCMSDYVRALKKYKEDELAKKVKDKGVAIPYDARENL